VERRFAPIRSPDDFLASEDGIDRLDGICMMLIATTIFVRMPRWFFPCVERNYQD
jgi:hypothetical protein